MMTKLRNILFLVLLSSIYSNSQNVSSFEIRLIQFPGVEGEYRYYIRKYLSTDFTAGMVMPSARIGISFYPVSFLFFQPSIGILKYSDLIVDGPKFDPEYFYSLRAGVHFPVGNTPFALSLGFGKMTIVDNNYNPNSDFVIVNSPKLRIRKEIRAENTLSLGITYNFR
jgi:hypothetical protein